MFPSDPDAFRYARQLMEAWEFNTAMSNLAACLRVAGALASAWNRGAMNGAAWATGREVLHRFGPEAR